MIIAVIPARGGSKRIPRKNIRDFCGKPIIAYSIKTALATGLFDSIIVSTDDETIAEIARTYGAETPFTRPSHLADNFTGTTPVLRHALEWCLDNGRKVEAVCGLYATAPFILPRDLIQGHAALTMAPASFAVTTFPYPIQRGLSRNENGRMSLLWPEHSQTRSQDLPEAFHDCGQFYWANATFLLSGKEFMDGEAIGVHIPRHRVQDIDTEEDWVRAETMYRVLKEIGEL
ncbi:pseudaminic acid cytidylyltransferase [Pseudodesulfovibrio sp. F-1]|uniref:Pseudaminic acid cytidylyltransferase n=1 Tax=Pseudodesulfovibrio alkaliphilus TaxID=2661613 RepID=A0A7K1KLK2_9BACT|nr:pseudaminic acid cytidylyltransferase [Pseudodesulfovibrio alkaliphilus]MUM76958.1 pseudaminic acid cytidylyltransferase [Pseudodesulfovibrio alkaliphilus]